MSDYSNIQRVVIRRPVGLEEAIKAFRILQVADRQLDVLRVMADRQVLPKIIVDHMMMQIDSRIEEAVKLSGFTNADDMKYWIENFKDL